MTEPSTCLETEPPISNASQIMLDLIVVFLTPMFVSVSNGNMNHARLAAIETVNAYYRPPAQLDLLAIAQIIAFGLAALDSLSLSMTDTLPPSLILRLRANAAACNRSAEQNRRVLQQNAPHPAKPELNEVAKPADITATQQQTQPQNPQLPQPQPATQQQTQWAAAAARVAAEYTADLANLSPAQRSAATFKAALLNSCAQDLLNGPPIPRITPAELRASFRS